MICGCPLLYVIEQLCHQCVRDTASVAHQQRITQLLQRANPWLVA